MGLAHPVVKRLLEAVVRGAKQQGTAVLLVERRGRIQLTGSARELLTQIADIENHYLAVVAGG